MNYNVPVHVRGKMHNDVHFSSGVPSLIMFSINGACMSFMSLLCNDEWSENCILLMIRLVQEKAG